MTELKPEKVEAYEKFVNEKLRTDLEKVLAEQDLIYTDIAEYLQLKDTIEKLSATPVTEPLTTKVDLGCNFYANAVVPDVSMIFVSIGYGFHLEMTFPEALKFIEKKCAVLNLTVKELTDKANEIKANIKFVLEGLKEIQQMKLGETKPKVDLR